jgi:hypothetical protein
MLLWCHFNAMVIMGSCVKWFNMNVEEFKIKIEKIYILGFGFNKGPLNLNNGYIKSSQFCKLLSFKRLF